MNQNDVINYVQAHGLEKTGMNVGLVDELALLIKNCIESDMDDSEISRQVLRLIRTKATSEIAGY